MTLKSADTTFDAPPPTRPLAFRSWASRSHHAIERLAANYHGYRAGDLGKAPGQRFFQSSQRPDGATLVEMVRNPGASALIRNIKQEVESVTRTAGTDLLVSIDHRTAGAEKVVCTKPPCCGISGLRPPRVARHW